GLPRPGDRRGRLLPAADDGPGAPPGPDPELVGQARHELGPPPPPRTVLGLPYFSDFGSASRAGVSGPPTGRRTTTRRARFWSLMSGKLTSTQSPGWSEA